MKKRILICMVLVFSLLLGTPSVFAATSVNIDFDSLAIGTFREHQEDGFKIQFVGYGDLPAISDVAGNHVLKDSALNMYGSEVSITSLDGENFYFNSLDYSNLLNNSGGNRIEIQAFPYPFSWATAKIIRLYPTSSKPSTLTSAQLGVEGVELYLLRVNNVSVNADYSIDNINLTHVVRVLEVGIDIKPGSQENPINLKKKGQLPVAILGSSSFDVTQIDASSIKLGSTKLSTHGKTEKLAYSFEDINNDGFMDMMTFFNVSNLALTSNHTELTLTATLSDNRQITGSDTITIVP